MPRDFRKILHQKLIKKAHLCQKCSLCHGRLNPVVGDGSLRSKILLVGEAPGRNEDQSGLPFVGKAGKVLDRLIEAAGFTRQDVFITSLLKCRPPENRNPTAFEINSCADFLEDQIAIIKPKVIAPLGNFAVKYFFERCGLGPCKISDVHGRLFILPGSRKWKYLMPQFHPAVAVYNARKFPVLKNDFLKFTKFV